MMVVDLDPFVLDDIRRTHEILIDGHAADVIQIGLSDGRAVYFRFQQSASHEVILWQREVRLADSP